MPDRSSTKHKRSANGEATSSSRSGRTSLIVLANVTRILKAPEIAAAGIGALCFHPSLLPRHRGGDAVYWTFKMGDRESSVTWLWIDEGIDTGPIAIRGSRSDPRRKARRRNFTTRRWLPLGARLFDALLGELERGARPSTIQASRRPPRRCARPTGGVASFTSAAIRFRLAAASSRGSPRSRPPRPRARRP